MSNRLLIAKDDGTVAEMGRIVAAKSGEAKNVGRALVVCDGVARQFWPPDVPPGTSDPRITWTTDPIDVRMVQESPSDANAALIFNWTNGNFTYPDYPPLSNIEGSALSPPPSTIGEYVMKIDQDSGDTLQIGGKPFGTWFQIDPLEVAQNVGLFKDGATAGVLQATGRVSIAPDLGGGTPDLTKDVEKPLTWYAEVTGAGGPNDIVWSAVQWDLEEIKQNEQANCTLDVSPDGTATGDGDTSGPIMEVWSNNPQGTETVTVTLVSGTAPTGPTLGAPHVLSTLRSWKLETVNPDDDLNCELDVLIDNGSTSNTKRVTMHSQRTDQANEVVWTTDPASVFDIGVGVDAGIQLISQANGQMVGQGTNSGQSPPFPIDWHSAAPSTTNGNDYEIRFRLLSGDAPDAGGTPLDVWFLAGSNWELNWTITFGIPVFQIKSATVEVGYRPIGQSSSEVFKTISIQLNTEGVT